MNRLIVYICFYWPLLSSGLNVQGFVTKFMSVSLGQMIAYFNVSLILLGIILVKKNRNNFSQSGKLWLIYYAIYFSFALLASGIHGPESSIMAALVAPIYFIGFYFLLSNEEEVKPFCGFLTFIFVTSALFTIYFQSINFSYDVVGVHSIKLDRAEGLYGDANNAALSSIIAYILFDNLFKPKILIFRIFKIISLLILFYSLFITFSTTGLFTFVIVLFISKYKYFTGVRFFLIAIAIILFYFGVFVLKTQINYLDLSLAQTKKIENIINLITFNFENVNSSGRTDLIENMLPYLYEHPILGNGIDFSNFMRGHNTYLGVWIDAGLFTFLYFIAILLFYLLKSFFLKLNKRLLIVPILMTLYIFMISLQTVINQAYLIVLIVLTVYILDEPKETNKNFQ